MTTSLPLIGYASGIAANDPGCAEGPLQLQSHALEQQLSEQNIPCHWQAMLVPRTGSKKDCLQRVVELNVKLANLTFNLTQNNECFAVLGGDHSCAIGTWSGVVAALEKQQQNELGLIWIDAHMDSHTFETTSTGNIHGMPLASLLGYGDKSLTHMSVARPKLNPKNLVLIGIRSFEMEEEKLLKNLGVRIYNMEEIKKQGLDTVFSEALAYVKKNNVRIGITLDLDGIDPFDAPGVGVPEANGICGENLCQTLTQLRHESSLIGVEVVEYNPYHDMNQKTERLIKEILLSIFGV